MRDPFLKLLKEYLVQSIQAVAGIDFYEDVISDIENRKAKEVTPIHDELKKILADKELTGKMTVAEQQMTGKNEINFRHTLREMDDALSHLMQNKWSRNTHMALWILEDVKLFLDYVISGATYDLTEQGQDVKAKNLLNVKKFQASDYVGKIASCQILLSTVSDMLDEGAFGEDEDLPNIKFTIRSGIGKAIMVLQHEIEDREANGPPEKFEFEIPEILVPEIPEEAPDEPTVDLIPDPTEAPADAEQLEVELK